MDVSKQLSQENYIYDDQNELGTFTPEGKIKQLRISGLNEEALFIKLNDQTHSVLNDAQGHVRLLVDPTKRVTHRYTYTSFGEERESQELSPNPWRYASKRFDRELKLIYFGKRYYDPELARWLSPDPAGFLRTNNLYHYLYNNPFRYIDPDGQNPVVITLTLFEFVWGATGIAICTPALPAIGAALAITGAAWFGYRAGAALNGDIRWGQFFESFMAKRKKGRETDEKLPEDPHNDPDWEDISHPDAKANGHHTFKNKKTGEIIRFDEGEPGKPGHRGHDHYHRPNPNSKSKKDKYFDKDGNLVADESEESHLYHPNKPAPWKEK